MSSSSGVKVNAHVYDRFNELKLKKIHKYLIFKLSDDHKEIVVEHTGTSHDWEEFCHKLIQAKFSTSRGETKSPRYALYDFEYFLSSGDGKRNKICFLAWSPDDAGIQPKMLYASSRAAFRQSLNGVSLEIQANDPEDLEYESILEKVKSG